MIIGFRHKGLRKLYETGSAAGVEGTYVAKLRRILSRLEAAGAPGDMEAPSFRLHPLKGELKGYWSVTVGANWRVVFRFEGMDVTDIDLVDYH